MVHTVDAHMAGTVAKGARIAPRLTKIEDHRTLRERIVESLRNAIMDGSLPAGSRVAEPDLAERFGISRTPIREAFRQLESEGFLAVVPRKGAVVAPLSAKDVSDFYEVKAILEGYAARRAATRVGAEGIARMERLNAEMSQAAAARDSRRVHDLHNEFHEVFLDACGNDRLAMIVRGLVLQFRRFRLLLAMPGRIEGILRQHQEIIEAFRKGDADQAEALVRKNAEYGKELLLKELSKG
jgi:DNA-binding GntR family transcriptional regulator